MGTHGTTRFSPFTLLFYGLSFGALLWLIVLGPTTILAPFTNPTTAAQIILMAILATIVPFGAFLTALNYIPPTNATVAAMIEPVVAALAAALLLAETLTIPLITGGLLIIAAIILIQLTDTP
jgi:DME family drug/metabolite transporter